MISIGGIVFSIYELAKSMGEGIIKQGQQAIKSFGRELKEIASKQGEPFKSILHGLGSLLEFGADGLDVLRDHFIAVSVIILFVILATYWGFSGSSHKKGRKGRIKVRKEEER